MNTHNHIIDNSSLKLRDFPSESLFMGEKLIMKDTGIKVESTLTDAQKGMNIYLTNFRIVLMNQKYIFDLPLAYITSHSVEKPYIWGSNKIVLSLNSKPLDNIPLYLKENLKTMNHAYKLPSTLEIKFKENEKLSVDEFYNQIKAILSWRQWSTSFKTAEEQAKEQEPSKPISSLGLSRAKEITMKKIEENSRMISSSLGSFDSMAENTKLMVELAQTLKAKLKNREGNDEVANVLQNIGYVDPVTKESFGENYETLLTKQIDEFFASYLEKKIITLTDAFCIYNRARGINIISPKEMKEAVNKLNSLGKHVRTKAFSKNIVVLHTKDFELDALVQRILQAIGREGADLNRLDAVIGMNNLSMTKLFLDDLIANGKLCLDVSNVDVLYFNNLFLDRP